MTLCFFSAGDEESIDSARVSLCRFAFTLHRIYNTAPEEEKTPAKTDAQSGTEADKRAFGFEKFAQGPMTLKRDSGIFSDNYKRKFDPRKTAYRTK